MSSEAMSHQQAAGQATEHLPTREQTTTTLLSDLSGLSVSPETHEQTLITDLNADVLGLIYSHVESKADKAAFRKSCAALYNCHSINRQLTHLVCGCSAEEAVAQTLAFPSRATIHALSCYNQKDLAGFFSSLCHNGTACARLSTVSSLTIGGSVLQKDAASKIDDLFPMLRGDIDDETRPPPSGQVHFSRCFFHANFLPAFAHTQIQLHSLSIVNCKFEGGVTKMMLDVGGNKFKRSLQSLTICMGSLNSHSRSSPALPLACLSTLKGLKSLKLVKCETVANSLNVLLSRIPLRELSLEHCCQSTLISTSLQTLYIDELPLDGSLVLLHEDLPALTSVRFCRLRLTSAVSEQSAIRLATLPLQPLTSAEHGDTFVFTADSEWGEQELLSVLEGLSASALRPVFNKLEAVGFYARVGPGVITALAALIGSVRELRCLEGFSDDAGLLDAVEKMPLLKRMIVRLKDNDSCPASVLPALMAAHQANRSFELNFRACREHEKQQLQVLLQQWDLMTSRLLGSSVKHVNLFLWRY